MTDDLDRLRRSLEMLEAMRERLDASHRRRVEPIAILGIGCRFPGGAEDPRSYWTLLERGRDAISEAPADRRALFDAAGHPGLGWGGFLPRIDGFDADFFGIGASEAEAMDPQLRLLLEVAWQTLEDAGQLDGRLAGSDTGVYVALGSQSSDYAFRQLSSPERIGRHTVTGTFHSLMAGRLSYEFDWTGPSVVVDAACASSLVALHQACLGLRSGECRTALVAASNLILSPAVSIALHRSGLHSPSRRCRAFDASADGFVRGEGCAALFLKRLSDAEADGDRILALVLGSAVGQDGRSNGPTAPNGPAQERVLRRALSFARVDPARVALVEAHGTGTALGDAIEAHALGAVYGSARSSPLLVGSVKTNLGHLEAAAGLAGVIKVVLSLHHRRVPAHLHLRHPNPEIDLEALGLAIPTECVPWDGSARVAGVSAFGMSGTNAHAVLGEAPGDASPAPEANRPCLLALSARDPEALRSLCGRMAAVVRAEESLADVCREAVRGRRAFETRLALISETREGMAEALEAAAEGRADAEVPSNGPAGMLDLARRFLRGEAVDWARELPARRAGVFLPPYPFRPSRYWLEADVPESAPAVRDLFHRVTWERTGPRGGGLPEGGWLVFGGGPVGLALVRSLEAAGRPAHLVLDPGDRDALAAVVERVGAPNVVHLGGLDTTLAARTSLESLTRDVDASCGSLLSLVQVLARLGPRRLWVVTRGARDGECVQAPLAGLARAVPAEHPELRCRHVDLDPGEGTAASLLAELGSGDEEAQVVLRGGERLVARLAASRDAVPAAGELDPEGLYLVTGGQGGIGRAVAESLVERGARHLVVMGRRARRVGASVEVIPVAGDVSREADVDRLMRAIDDTGRPLKGVVHAAGVVADLLLARHDWATFREALGAKVEGAWLLHEKTLDRPLDFFVLFSSITSVVGLTGASNYVAANSFLDALARFRRACGLPGLAIAWGTWEGTGMADAGDRRREEWARHGIGSFSARIGVAAFHEALLCPDAHLVVANADWERLARAARHAGTASLFENLAGGSPLSKAAGPAPARRETSGASGPADLLECVREAVASALGLAPGAELDVERPLGELGLDSIRAVELRHLLADRLARPLPATLAFNHPTISAIRRFLDRDRPAPSSDRIRRIEGMTEEEVEARLFEQIGDLEGKSP